VIRDYLTIADVLAIHQIQIRKYGGTNGVRDMGALDSALQRPQSGYYKTLNEEAAALIESVAMNHPFIDGNKRVAFACGDIFLRINGYRINSNSKNIYKLWMKLFGTNNLDFKHLTEWLNEVVVKEDC
jgi:death-on-curing protein